MTQLVEGQPAALDVGESLPCRIIGFSGPEVVLALEAQPAETIAVGMRAYLMLESNGQLQAVRGEITAPSAEEVVLRLTDDIRLGQRRVFSRAPIPLPAEVRTKDGSTWTTTTRDVSAGGVCVGREGADPGDGPLELKITVASHEVVCEAPHRQRDRRPVRAHPGRRPTAARQPRAGLSPTPLTRHLPPPIDGALGSI